MTSAAGQKIKGARKCNRNSIGAAVANLVGNVVDNTVGLVEDVANDSAQIANATQQFPEEASGG